MRETVRRHHVWILFRGFKACHGIGCYVNQARQCLISDNIKGQGSCFDVRSRYACLPLLRSLLDCSVGVKMDLEP